MTKECAQERAEQSTERRSSGRVATVFRPVLIDTEQLTSFCLVRNLSPFGLMGRVYTTLPHGTAISVRFHPALTAEGSVAWSKDGQLGIRFDQPIDVDGVLSDLVRKLPDGKVSRAPRLPIQCKAELGIADRTLVIELRDISQRGIKACASFVRPGDVVQVKIPGLEPRKAVVRWTRPELAGLHFVRPLSLDELAHWAIEQQAGTRRPKRPDVLAC